MMNGWVRLGVLGVIGSGVSAALALADSNTPTRAFAVSIDGTDEATVVAACLVNTGQDVEVVTLKGKVPQQREFAALSVSCQIQKIGRTGRIDVQIKRDGRIVSRSQSSGQSGVISVSVQ